MTFEPCGRKGGVRVSAACYKNWQSVKRNTSVAF